jgi:hypothetical protein
MKPDLEEIGNVAAVASPAAGALGAALAWWKRRRGVVDRLSRLEADVSEVKSDLKRVMFHLMGEQ